MQRRSLLKTGLWTLLGVLHGGWLGLRQPLAAERPAKAFAAEERAAAHELLFGDQAVVESDAIRLGIADLAENGAVVPVKVDTSLPDVESITLFAEKNPVPLVAQFRFHAPNPGFVATRIKMAESADVIAVVQSQGKLYSARKFVEVTVGGC